MDDWWKILLWLMSSSCPLSNFVVLSVGCVVVITHHNKGERWVRERRSSQKAWCGEHLFLRAPKPNRNFKFELSFLSQILSMSFFLYWTMPCLYSNQYVHMFCIGGWKNVHQTPACTPPWTNKFWHYLAAHRCTTTKLLEETCTWSSLSIFGGVTVVYMHAFLCRIDSDCWKKYKILH